MLAMDWGAGNMKIYGSGGGVIVPSQVAVAGEGVIAGPAMGLRVGNPPMVVRLNGHRFYVGLGAHDWGRPVENLDDGRFSAGSPELRALTYATLSEYRIEVSLPAESPVWIGLPQSALTPETVAGIRGWLKGIHEWKLEYGEIEEPRAITFTDVTVSSQAAGALFDWLLDDDGNPLPARKAQFKGEIGIISVGMNTVELLVVENGKPKERFTASEPMGVRRLLEFVDPRGMYSRGELDTQLRYGTLDVAAATPVWASEVIGAIENHWGRAARRFNTTVVVGGGALLLGPALTVALSGKTAVADDPVLAVARGLWKLALSKKGKRG